MDNEQQPTRTRTRTQTEVLTEQLVRALESDLQLESFLKTEQARRRVQLSDGATLMLLVPLLEAKQQLLAMWPDGKNVFSQRELDNIRPETIEDSLKKLLDAMTESPAEVDRVLSTASQPRRLTALSVIKSFWSKFCNIPPFCGESKSEKRTA